MHTNNSNQNSKQTIQTNNSHQNSPNNSDRHSKTDIQIQFKLTIHKTIQTTNSTKQFKPAQKLPQKTRIRIFFFVQYQFRPYKKDGAKNKH